MTLKFLLKFWKALKASFYRLGGFRNPLNYVLFIIFWWGLMAFLRERGWYRKKSLHGKHIFITGAGSGLGRRMAIEFAKLGARLSISDIDYENVLETKAIIDKLSKKKKIEVLASKLDVSNRETVKQIAHESKTKMGDVDILINNAGIVQGKTYKDMDEFMIKKTLTVNLESHYWLINEFLGPML